MRIKSLRSLLVLSTATLLWAAAPAESPVADAAMRKDAAGVRALLQQGADVNGAQGDGMTALHWAATRGDANQVPCSCTLAPDSRRQPETGTTHHFTAARRPGPPSRRC
jgi:ankyrin repeat protein